MRNWAASVLRSSSRQDHRIAVNSGAIREPKQTAERSVTRMSDNDPEERRKTSVTQTPN